MSETFKPRLNHVAISVDAAVLDESGRAALIDFYSEVFGWSEGDNSTESGNPLILYTGSLRQFLYLLPAEENYLVAPRLDHFGLEVASAEELDEIMERARAYQRKDARVTIIETSSMRTHGPTDDYTLTNGYIGFLIPLMIEIQYIAKQARP